MAFKIQDLMTDVLPEPGHRAQLCPGGLTCAGGEGYFAAGSKGGEKPPQCPPVSRGGGSPKPKPPKRPPADYADLALLQRQLQQALSVQA